MNKNKIKWNIDTELIPFFHHTVSWIMKRF